MSRCLFATVRWRTEESRRRFFSYLRSAIALEPKTRVHRDESSSPSARSWALDSRTTVRCRLRNCLSMDSKRVKREVEWVSSLFMLSSSTESSSVKAWVSVSWVRCERVRPNSAVINEPRRVGMGATGMSAIVSLLSPLLALADRPVGSVSSTPRRDSMLWKLSKNIDDRVLGG